MSAWYSEPLTIPLSACDGEGLLAWHKAFELFMDIAATHAERLGVGMVPMLRRNLFWLTVRTKVRFVRRPAMLAPATLSTRPIVPGEVRCQREYRLAQDGAPLVLGRTEWAVMDVRTGRPVPMAGVFPEGVEMAAEPDYADPFLRVTGSLAHADILGEHVVRSTDIDVGGHMNNAAYVRAMLGLIPRAQLKAMDPSEIEVVFLSPCFEGEALTFRTREKDGAREVAAFRPDGKLALLGILRR